MDKESRTPSELLDLYKQIKLRNNTPQELMPILEDIWANEPTLRKQIREVVKEYKKRLAVRICDARQTTIEFNDNEEDYGRNCEQD